LLKIEDLLQKTYNQINISVFIIHQNDATIKNNDELNIYD